MYVFHAVTGKHDFGHHLPQIVADGNLARLAPFLAEVNHPLVPAVVEIRA